MLSRGSTTLLTEALIKYEWIPAPRHWFTNSSYLSSLKTSVLMMWWMNSTFLATYSRPTRWSLLSIFLKRDIGQWHKSAEQNMQSQGFIIDIGMYLLLISTSLAKDVCQKMGLNTTEGGCTVVVGWMILVVPLLLLLLLLVCSCCCCYRCGRVRCQFCAK